MKNRALSYIGLATKAGKTASGEFSTEKAIKEGKAFLVIVAEDASDNTKKNFRNACAWYHVPVCIFATKEELGASTGKAMRASLAVLDEGLAKAILKLGMPDTVMNEEAATEKKHLPHVYHTEY